MLKTKYILQCRKPHGLSGRIVLSLMDIWHRPFRSWVLASAGMEKESSVLDVGCGSGLYIKEILKRGCARADGVDISAESVAVALKRTSVYRDRCTIMTAPADDLPFDSEAYDVVLAADTVIYWDDIHSAFMEISRVLKPGGVFYIASELSDRGDAPGWVLGSEHINVRTPSELADALLDAGFTEVSIVNAHGPWLLMEAIK